MIVKLIKLIRKVFKLIYETLFEPVFFLSTILIAFVINSFFSVSVDNLPRPISFLINDRIYSLSIIVAWGICCFLKNNSDEMKNQIVELTNSLEVKNQQIKESSGILEARYGEFAESISKNNINKILRTTVKRFPLVEACHIYSYELQRIDNYVGIKINFLQGYEQESICINAIKQNYYKIDKHIYKELQSLKSVKDKDKEVAIELIYRVWNNIQNGKLHFSIKSRLNEIIFLLLCEYLDYDNKGFEEISKSEESLDSFRTGIIGSILLDKGYIYKYRREKSNKKGRVYFSTPIILDSEYILNIAIDGTDLRREELFNMFEDVVLFIKKEYNKLIGGHEND